MTAKWICRQCNMLCIDQTHYARHASGNHGPTTYTEFARLKTKAKEEITLVELERRVGELEEKQEGLQSQQRRQLESRSFETQRQSREIAELKEYIPKLLVRVWKWELGVYLKKTKKVTS